MEVAIHQVDNKSLILLLEKFDFILIEFVTLPGSLYQVEAEEEASRQVEAVWVGVKAVSSSFYYNHC